MKETIKNIINKINLHYKKKYFKKFIETIFKIPLYSLIPSEKSNFSENFCLKRG